MPPGPRHATRDDVLGLVAAGAQLVEVLPYEEYEWAHLPGAMHLPFKLFDPSVLDDRRPVIVYCHDFL